MISDVVLLVTGTRHELPPADENRVGEAVRRVVNAAYSHGRTTRLIVGCASGVDAYAASYFTYLIECGAYQSALFSRHVYRADWTAYGDKAGPHRNQLMVDDGAALRRLFGAELACLAFPAPDSRGTHDCARRARKAGYNVTFVPVCEG